jgi:hypothetical protein
MHTHAQTTHWSSHLSTLQGVAIGIHDCSIEGFVKLDEGSVCVRAIMSL